MGCDIHTHVETYSESKKQWINGDLFKVNPYYIKDEVEDGEKEFTVVELCGDRNYGLFAILADVRNYGDTEYIDEPRGIPDDCNEMIKKDFEDWGCDAHSASYFTLKELMDFYKEHPAIKHAGLISPSAAKALDEYGVTPNTWCQGTSDTTFVHRSWETPTPLAHLIDELKKRAFDLYFVFSEDQLLGNADKIRFVFWFDN